MTDRPTTDPKHVVLDLFDQGWEALDARLEGLGDDEYLWAPVPDVWTVRPGPDGAGIVDAAGDHMESVTGPVTTIAWRMWHLAVDCFDMYSSLAFGRTGASVVGDTWFLDGATAHRELAASAGNFRDAVGERSSDDLWQVLGDDWGPYRDHSLYDLVQHASHELLHHGAEIALLRDLHRSGPT